jgi:hypothetical protein
MKKSFFLLSLAAVVFSGCHKQMKKNITWIGCPVFNDNDKYFPSSKWLPEWEYGVRDDGIMVARKKK